LHTAPAPYTQTSTGTLEVGIAGEPATNDFGVLAAGPVTVDGTLQIDGAVGFTPNLGDVFPIVTASSETGTFAAVNGAPIGTTELYSPVYSASGIDLDVIKSTL